MPALVPPENIVQLSHNMADADETMRTILEETLESGERVGDLTESGRTACGDTTSLREPFQRFPESVELQSCPRGLVGVWHSHTRPNEMLAPEHSLPDLANVAFGVVDVSVVAGAESAEVVVGAENRTDMADTFRSVLGLEVRTTEEVVDAIHTGLIQDPPAARQRIRTHWEQLVFREQTGYDDLAHAIRDLELPAEPETVPGVTAACPMHTTEQTHDGQEAAAAAQQLGERGADPREAPGGIQVRRTTAPQRLRDQARSGGDLLHELTGDLTIREQVIGSAIGIVAGRVVERALFGE